MCCASIPASSQGARTIVAFGAVDGTPRGSQVVARYAAPPLDHVSKPQAPRIVYREGRADTPVRWRRVSGAPNYVVTLHSSDERNVTFVVNGLSLEIAAIAPGDRLTVTVQARTSEREEPAHVPLCTSPASPGQRSTEPSAPAEKCGEHNSAIAAGHG